MRPSGLCETLRRFGIDVEFPHTPEQRSLLAIGEWGVVCNVGELAAAYRKLSMMRGYELIREGLDGAVRFGTARLAQPRTVAVRGKTGTSPNRYRSGTYAWFAGWAPANRPKAVVAVVVPGGSGGADAAPVARALFEKFT